MRGLERELAAAHQDGDEPHDPAPAAGPGADPWERPPPELEHL